MMVNKQVVKIFVSHRHEDEKVARTLKRRLEILGADRLKLLLSEDITPGADWFKWIQKNLDRANLLLVLYTAPDKNWDWCLYETGRFEAREEAKIEAEIKAKADDRSIVVLHCNGTPPPLPLKHLQTIKVSLDDVNLKMVKSFLRDLFGSKKYVDEPINKGFADDDKSVTELATEICTLFEEEPLIPIPRWLFLKLYLPLAVDQVKKIKNFDSEWQAFEYIKEVIKQNCVVTEDSDEKIFRHFSYDRWENGLTIWKLFERWRFCQYVNLYDDVDWFSELSIEMMRVVRNTPAGEVNTPFKSCSEFQTWYLPVINRAQSSKNSCAWKFCLEFYRIPRSGVIIPSKKATEAE